MPRSRDPNRSREARAVCVLRTNVGLTQSQLGERAGLNKSSVSAIEIGRQPIAAARVRVLLDAMGYAERVWPATLGYLEWLDHLRDGGTADDLETVAAVVESFAQQVERHLAAVVRAIGKADDGE